MKLKNKLSSLLAMCGFVFAPAANADWLALPDGDYAVTLNCPANEEWCIGSITGELSIMGSGADFMSFSVDGLDFIGDPADSTVSPSTGNTNQVSNIILNPFSILALRYITEGTLSGFEVGDRIWTYCENITNTQTCSPQPSATWSARLLNEVPEPSSVALVLLAAGLLPVIRRRGRGLKASDLTLHGRR